MIQIHTNYQFLTKWLEQQKLDNDFDEDQNTFNFS